MNAAAALLWLATVAAPLGGGPGGEAGALETGRDVGDEPALVPKQMRDPADVESQAVRAIDLDQG